MTRRVAVASVTRLSNGAAEHDQDLVAVEAPLSLTVSHPAAGSRSLGLLMRTPGDDEDLVLGVLVSEGVVRAPDDVDAVAVDARDDRDTPAQARVTLSARVQVDWSALARHLDGTSSCGLCGRAALPSAPGVRRHGVPRVSAGVIATIPDRLRAGQSVFDETGGLHAAGLFSSNGELQLLREDVGRHNAVDKVIGALFRAGALPAADAVLAVSGRVAYEIVQKAAAAGIAVVVAVGAPSSLAVDAARAAAMTLIGFARDGRFNVYTGSERVG